MSRAAELEVLAAEAAGGIRYGAWAPAAARLREKGWTYDEVYDFLRGHGEVLPENRRTFGANMSKWLKRRRLAAAGDGGDGAISVGEELVPRRVAGMTMGRAGR
jgi:hypothetical protein